jgi:hypothetical protein
MIVDRFWSKVNKANGCWTWNAGLNRDGYGSIKIKGKFWLAHRYAMVLAGHIIEGKVVCHKCDNPSCVNPDHLFVGTQADNVKDMIAKNRYVKPQSKLSAADIIAIQESTDSYKEIGKRFNISAPYVCNIKRKVTS